MRLELLAPLSIALVAIVLRGAAHGFRADVDAGTRSHVLLSRLFGAASVVAPFAFGLVAGGESPWHVFFVLGFGPLAVMIAVLRPAAAVTMLGGVWPAASPWILGYALDHAAWLNELVAGALPAAQPR